MTTAQRKRVTAETLQPPGGASREHAHRWWILVVVAIAQLVVVLDATIVNIALPTAQRALGFSDDDRQWVVTAYALAFGSLLLVGGRLSDRLGRKRMFMTGLLGFAIASAVGGAAGNFGVLVSARAAQGIFGALLAPAALSILTVTFSQAKERSRAFAIYGAVAGAGGAVGLILGGALTEYLSWRWCLYVNLPIAAIAIFGAAVLLGNQSRPAATARLDLPGALLSVAGLVAVVYGLAEAVSEGWSSGVTLGLIGLGVALLTAFCFVENSSAHPLLPLRVILDRTRGGSYLALGVASAGLFGVFLFLTYYVSTVLKYTPLLTGVSFLPMIAGIVVAAQLSAPLALRIGPKLPVALGLALGAIGLFTLTHLGLGSTYATDVLPGLILTGLGAGMAFAPAISSATAGVDQADAGIASATVNTFQQIGGSIATAALSAFAASAAADYLAGKNTADPIVRAQAAVESYTTAFGWAAGFLAAGAVICGLLLPWGAVATDPAVKRVHTEGP